MSISPVLTYGFGSFGAAALIPTAGFGIGDSIIKDQLNATGEKRAYTPTGQERDYGVTGQKRGYNLNIRGIPGNEQ